MREDCIPQLLLVETKHFLPLISFLLITYGLGASFTFYGRVRGTVVYTIVLNKYYVHLHLCI